MSNLSNLVLAANVMTVIGIVALVAVFVKFLRSGNVEKLHERFKRFMDES